jgi:hypothetical protein
MPSTPLEAKLDAILLHLERMDRRDQLRTWGGLARSLIAIVPVLLFLWASWYATTHADQIIQKIAAESARQAAKYTEQQSESLMEQFRKAMR